MGLLPIVMLGPRVEVEMHDGRAPLLHSAFCLLPSHKDRPGVARPAARGGMEHELNAVQVGARARKIAARELLIGVAVDEDADNLTRANLPHDLSINPTRGARVDRPK